MSCGCSDRNGLAVKPRDSTRCGLTRLGSIPAGYIFGIFDDSDDETGHQILLLAQKRIHFVIAKLLRPRWILHSFWFSLSTFCHCFTLVGFFTVFDSDNVEDSKNWPRIAPAFQEKVRQNSRGLAGLTPLFLNLGVEKTYRDGWKDSIWPQNSRRIQRIGRASLPPSKKTYGKIPGD